MERKNANYAVKKEAQRLYEVDGLSDKKVGEALGFHQNTITGWRRKEGWAARGSIDPAAVVSEVGTPNLSTEPEAEAVSGYVPSNEEEVNELRARIVAIEAEKAEMREEMEKLRPDVDITAIMYETEEDFERVFDEQYWRDRAQREYASINKQRRIEGLDIIKVEEAEMQETISRIKQEELAGRRRPADGPADKRIKMVKPNQDGSYFPPHVVSLPYESQVNNVAGSLADGLVIYTTKGYKLTRPFLCPRRKCFRPAAVDLDGNWAFDGYCTQEHRIEVEKPQNANPMQGVTVRDAIGAIAGR